MGEVQPQDSASRGWVRAGLEVSLGSLLLAAALAALTGSPAMEAAAVAILAVGICQAILLRQSARDGSPEGLHFWSYGAGALTMALASGVAVALLVRAGAERAGDWPLTMELGGLAVLAAAQAGWLYWNLRDLVGPTRPLDLLPPHLTIADPVRTSVLICGVTGLVSVTLALVASAVAWAVPWPLVEAWGALLIALTLAAAAMYFAFETRAVMEHTKVDARLVRTLTEAIGVAALKTGAIRRVVEVEARYGAPGTVIATVQLDFKEGVDARHVAPVLATLHKAATAAVPAVGTLVLAGAETTKNGKKSDETKD
jgi:hypothetical protein